MQVMKQDDRIQGKKLTVNTIFSTLTKYIQKMIEVGEEY